METEGSLTRRGKALEDEFFFRVDQQLAAEMRIKLAAESDKKELAESCNLHDEKLLNDLVSAGIKAETLVGLSLVPLVRTAWADGEIDDKERTAVLKAAEENNCPAGTASYQLLDHWLQEQPQESLFEAWKEYVDALRESLDDSARATLKTRIMQRTRNVAKASGGILGIGSISTKENEVLDEVEAVLDGS